LPRAENCGFLIDFDLLDRRRAQARRTDFHAV
jgi:hypothetical protein